MSAKITYDPGEHFDGDFIEFAGHRWVPGEMVTVSDAVAVRLLGNPHFVRDDKAQEREDIEAAAKAQAEAERIDAEKKMAEDAEAQRKAAETARRPK